MNKPTEQLAQDLVNLINLYGWAGDLNEIVPFAEWVISDTFRLDIADLNVKINPMVIDPSDTEVLTFSTSSTNAHWTMSDISDKANLGCGVFVLGKRCVNDDLGPRIKVAPPGWSVFRTCDMQSVSLLDHACLLPDIAFNVPDIVFKFIDLNFLALLRYWNEQISLVELTEQLIQLDDK